MKKDLLIMAALMTASSAVYGAEPITKHRLEIYTAGQAGYTIDLETIDYIDIVEYQITPTDPTAPGEGTLESPFNVDQIINLYNDPDNRLPYAVSGCIVGHVDGKRERSGIRIGLPTPESESSMWGLYCVVIADDPGETNPDKCIIVDLYDDGRYKDYSLSTHPELLGHSVTLVGIPLDSDSPTPPNAYITGLTHFALE